MVEVKSRKNRKEGTKMSKQQRIRSKDKSVRQRLKEDILGALNRVYAKDSELLADKIDVCERSLMHRFTHYFMEYVESCTDGFYDGLKVDGEYNRQGRDGNPKLRDGKPIYPDVIIHTRGENKRNLCVIEFKKENNGAALAAQGCKHDKDKLVFLTQDECGFKYDWGVHIILNVGESRGATMIWFKDGEMVGRKDSITLPFNGLQ